MPKTSYYQALAEQGKCVTCGKQNDRLPLKTCTACALRNKQVYQRWYQANRKKAKAKYRRWYKKNPAKVQTKCQLWRTKNPDKIKGYHSKRRQLLASIRSHYGCLNPKCCWQGPIDPVALDFHHIKGKKLYGLAQVGTRSLKVLAAEINKCTVLCAICHRLVTWGNLDASAFKTCRVTDQCNPV